VESSRRPRNWANCPRSSANLFPSETSGRMAGNDKRILRKRRHTVLPVEDIRMPIAILQLSTVARISRSPAGGQNVSLAGSWCLCSFAVSTLAHVQGYRSVDIISVSTWTPKSSRRLFKVVRNSRNIRRRLLPVSSDLTIRSYLPISLFPVSAKSLGVLRFLIAVQGASG